MAGEEFGVEYLPTDLKKKDGFKRSVELSRVHGLYRQNYCGCEYSKRKNTERRTRNAE
jgi:predicted adenine nucleotide alpha hydrolase (AANH) superfamily ATPase